jgi:hypothetical protein
MRYETVKRLKDEDFKRLTGVSREMFEKMLVVLQKDMRNFGREPKLGRADQLLMTLMYWREYPPSFILGWPMVSVKQLCAGRSSELEMC